MRPYSVVGVTFYIILRETRNNDVERSRDLTPETSVIMLEKSFTLPSRKRD